MTIFGDNFVGQPSTRQRELITERAQGHWLAPETSRWVMRFGATASYTPHLSYPPSAFSPVQEEASSTPDTHTHALAHTRSNTVKKGGSEDGNVLVNIFKYVISLSLSLSSFNQRVGKILHEPSCRVVVLLSRLRGCLQCACNLG